MPPASHSRSFLFLLLTEPHLPASSLPLPSNLCLLFFPSVFPISSPVSSHHETQSIRAKRCPVKVGAVGASLTGRHSPMPVPLVCVSGFSSELQSACMSQRGVVNTASQCGCSPASPTVSISAPNTSTCASPCRLVLASSIHFVLLVLLGASSCMVVSVHSQPHRNRVRPIVFRLRSRGEGRVFHTAGVGSTLRSSGEAPIAEEQQSCRTHVAIGRGP